MLPGHQQLHGFYGRKSGIPKESRGRASPKIRVSSRGALKKQSRLKIPVELIRDFLARLSRFRPWIIAGVIVGLSAAIFITRHPADRCEEPEAPHFILSCGQVKMGDTMAGILSSHGIPGPDIVAAQRALAKVLDLRRIIPGRRYEIKTSTTGVLQQVVYWSDVRTSYVVEPDGQGGWVNRVETRPTYWKEERIAGVTRENIYKDMLAASGDEPFVANVVSDLSDIVFAWRIDFLSEQRVGDRFVVLLEREHLAEDQKPLPNIRILAALYEGRGTKSRFNYAFRYKCKDGKRDEFFDEKGGASKGMFLRAPFNQRAFRISSRFSRSRFHPVLRIWRPHHGTDYAAPVGTPVVAIGSGKVVFSGWKGGYGNCIDIQHSKKYASRYGHLSKIAVQAGQTVAQGQYIGLSGNTGVSSGPHLHFEMHENDRQKDFLRLNFPSVKGIPKEEMADFQQTVDRYRPSLDNPEENVLVAQKER